jgi:xanthine dehydrogenase accessory factor
MTCARVIVTQTWGSTPREVGACMIITRDGYRGTIGGGTLEWRAMAEAQKLMQAGHGSRTLTCSLGPDMGQCCGGRVELLIEVLAAEPLIEVHHERTSLYLFGAGHVGRALSLALASLPFDVTWIDSRTNAFPSVAPANVKMLQPVDAFGIITAAPQGSVALVMTHSHALDLELVDALLRNPGFKHVGLIGSATKRARFEKRLREAGIIEEKITELACPIGTGGLRSKHPAVIAASTAVQLLQWHESLQATRTASHAKRAGA